MSTKAHRGRSILAALLVGVGCGASEAPSLVSTAAPAPNGESDCVERWAPEGSASPRLLESLLLPREPSAGMSTIPGEQIDIATSAGVLSVHGGDYRSICTRSGPAAVSSFVCTVERITDPHIDLLAHGTGAPASTSKLEIVGPAVVVGRSDGIVVIASYHPATTGAGVVAVDETTGRTVWLTRFGGMTCFHSAYSNALQLVVASGRAQLWGHESAGSYVVSLDLRDGHRICERFFEPETGGCPSHWPYTAAERPP